MFQDMTSQIRLSEDEALKVPCFEIFTLYLSLWLHIKVGDRSHEAEYADGLRMSLAYLRVAKRKWRLAGEYYWAAVEKIYLLIRCLLLRGICERNCCFAAWEFSDRVHVMNFKEIAVALFQLFNCEILVTLPLLRFYCDFVALTTEIIYIFHGVRGKSFHGGEKLPPYRKMRIRQVEKTSLADKTTSYVPL